MKLNRKLLTCLAIILSVQLYSGGFIRSIYCKSIDSVHYDDPGLCATDSCLAMSEYLKNSIDYDTNPCDNFYQFACGKSISRKENDSSLVINSFVENSIDVTYQIESMLTDYAKYPSRNNTNLIRLRNYYDSCENQMLLNELGNKPLMDVIQKVGGFPIIGDSSGWLPGNEKRISWIDRLIAFRSLGVEHNFLLSLSIAPNPKNNSLTEIYLDQPTPNDMDLMIEMGGSPVKAVEYALTLSRMVNLGASVITTGANHLPRLYSFKGSLAGIRNNLEDDYTQIKMDEFYSLGLSVDIRNYINQILGRELPGDQVINVNYEYLMALNKLMTKSDPKVVANYMLYKMIQFLGKYLDYAWSFEFLQERSCESMLQQDLNLAISHEYVKHFVSKESRDGVMKLVDKIITQTRVNIDEADWIKGSTRQIAKDKVDSIRSIVAYPEQLINSSFMDQLLSPYVMKSNDFFGNHLKIKKLDYDYESDRVNRDQRDSYWELFAMTTSVNAFYAPGFNSINILAGIMMGRVFDKLSPQYLNFGSIGSIIGHEITHAFDPMGSQFDKFGNRLSNGTWWNAETSVGYERNKKCFVDVYDGLPVPGNEKFKVNGTFTLGENMADNGGYQIAHEAYLLWVKEQGDKREPLLGGLDFNQDQLFWLSLATTWCDRVDPRLSGFMARIDPHSPPKYRVNIPFANAKHFSDAFQCSQGTYMNPENKCVVW